MGKLDEGLTEKQKQKQLDDMARDFEREVETGSYLDAGKITFEAFANKWLEDHAATNLRPKTIAHYRDILRRIIPAIGHIKLMNLQPTHLIQFYKNLAEGGMRVDYKFILLPDKCDLLKDTKHMATLSRLNERTVKSILKGNQTNAPSVEKICNALGMPVKSLFVAVDENKHLSEKTISEHHKLISSILSCIDFTFHTITSS